MSGQAAYLLNPEEEAEHVCVIQRSLGYKQLLQRSAKCRQEIYCVFPRETEAWSHISPVAARVGERFRVPLTLCVLKDGM